MSEDVLEFSASKDLTKDLLDNDFRSVRISESTDRSLAEDIKKSFFSRITPWLQDNTQLLPHEAAAMLLEYASEGNSMFISGYFSLY
jgi:hypothetical protein